MAMAGDPQSNTEPVVPYKYIYDPPDFTEIAKQYAELPPFWMSEDDRDRNVGCFFTVFASWTDFAVARDDDYRKGQALIRSLNLTDMTKIPTLMSVGKLEEEMPCLFFPENKWERGKIKSIDPGLQTAQVESVDIGMVIKDQPLDKLWPLPIKFAELHPTALNASFYNPEQMPKLNEALDQGPEGGPHKFIFLMKDIESESEKFLIANEDPIPIGGNANGEQINVMPKHDIDKVKPGYEPESGPGSSNRNYHQPFEYRQPGGKMSRCAYNSNMQFVRELFTITEYCYATSAEVEECGGGARPARRGANMNMPGNEGGTRHAVIHADSTKLNGGTIREVDLATIFKSTDVFKMSGSLTITEEGIDEATGDRKITEGEWRVTNIHTEDRQPKPAGESVCQGVLTELFPDKGGKVYSRVWLEYIWVPQLVLDSIKTDERVGGDTMLDMYRTVVFRARVATPAENVQWQCPFIATVLAIPHRAVEATGAIYFVREKLSVAIRIDKISGFAEGIENTSRDGITSNYFRYCFIPNQVIEAEGLNMREWYGMPVMFRCNEDQPGDPDCVNGEPRWKAFTAKINSHSIRTNIFKFYHIWYPSGNEEPHGGRMSEDERRNFDVHPETQREWSDMRPQQQGVRLQPSRAFQRVLTPVAELFSQAVPQPTQNISTESRPTDPAAPSPALMQFDSASPAPVIPASPALMEFESEVQLVDANDQVVHTITNNTPYFEVENRDNMVNLENRGQGDNGGGNNAGINPTHGPHGDGCASSQTPLVNSNIYNGMQNGVDSLAKLVVNNTTPNIIAQDVNLPLIEDELNEAQNGMLEERISQVKANKVGAVINQSNKAHTVFEPQPALSAQPQFPKAILSPSSGTRPKLNLPLPPSFSHGVNNDEAILPPRSNVSQSGLPLPPSFSGVAPDPLPDTLLDWLNGSLENVPTNTNTNASVYSGISNVDLLSDVTIESEVRFTESKEVVQKID